jgi:hypothetical protein
VLKPKYSLSIKNKCAYLLDVKDILQTLKIGKACGDDGITHQMLKSTSETICILLFLFPLATPGQVRFM